MKKSHFGLILSVLIFVILFTFTGATTAHATPTILTSDLYLSVTDATTGGQVSVLQHYLKDNGYFNTDVTGFFGQITQSAVINFQIANNLPPTGFVGPLTRARIATSERPQPTIAPVISSIDPNSGWTGSTVTLHGTGFAVIGNTVNFDEGTIKDISSSDGTSLTFTVPSSIQLSNGETKVLRRTTYNVSVSNGYATSNQVKFRISKITMVPTISSIDPLSATAGTRVTMQGTNFLGDNITVNFPSISVSTNSSTNNGRSLTFTVPNISPGVYPISVTTGEGTSDTETFTVTGQGSSAPTATYVAKISGQPDRAYSNDITVAVGDVLNSRWNSTNGSTYKTTFTNSCTPGAVGTLDSVNTASGTGNGTVASTQAGCTYKITYTVTSSGSSPQTAQATLIVRVKASSQATPILGAMVPGSAPVGTRVTVDGTNFTQTGNVFQFNGQDISDPNNSNGQSYNSGHTITFTVPQVTPGTYTLTMHNANGTSNSENFTVTASSHNYDTFGFLDVITTDGVAAGWAYDPDQPSTSIAVHFYIDGTFAGQANANQIRSDVNRGINVDGNHGFNWTIPNSYHDGRTHSLTVYGIDITGNGNSVLNYSPKNFSFADVNTPTASLTVNGSHNATVLPNRDSTNFLWHATNADQFTSSYTFDCSGQTGSSAWTAQNADGRSEGVVESYLAGPTGQGCTYVITYTVTKSSTNQSASDSVTVTVLPVTQARANTSGTSQTANALSALDSLVTRAGTDNMTAEIRNSINLLLKNLYEFVK